MSGSSSKASRTASGTSSDPPDQPQTGANEPNRVILGSLVSVQMQEILEMEYKRNSYCDGERKTQLAKRIGLSGTNITYWFKRRREQDREKEDVDDDDDDDSDDDQGRSKKFTSEQRKILIEFHNTVYPIPKSTDYPELCAKTNLTITQIRNWLNQYRRKLAGKERRDRQKAEGVDHANEDGEDMGDKSDDESDDDFEPGKIVKKSKAKRLKRKYPTDEKDKTGNGIFSNEPEDEDPEQMSENEAEPDITPEQEALFEALYAKTAYCQGKEMNEMVAKTQLSKKAVSRWFKQRRNRAKEETLLNFYNTNPNPNYRDLCFLMTLTKMDSVNRVDNWFEMKRRENIKRSVGRPRKNRPGDEEVFQKTDSPGPNDDEPSTSASDDTRGSHSNTPVSSSCFANRYSSRRNASAGPEVRTQPSSSSRSTAQSSSTSNAGSSSNTPVARSRLDAISATRTPATSTSTVPISSNYRPSSLGPATRRQVLLSNVGMVRGPPVIPPVADKKNEVVKNQAKTAVAFLKTTASTLSSVAGVPDHTTGKAAQTPKIVKKTPATQVAPVNVKTPSTESMPNSQVPTGPVIKKHAETVSPIVGRGLLVQRKTPGEGSSSSFRPATSEVPSTKKNEQSAVSCSSNQGTVTESKKKETQKEQLLPTSSSSNRPATRNQLRDSDTSTNSSQPVATVPDSQETIQAKKVKPSTVSTSSALRQADGTTTPNQTTKEASHTTKSNQPSAAVPINKNGESGTHNQKDRIPTSTDSILNRPATRHQFREAESGANKSQPARKEASAKKVEPRVVSTNFAPKTTPTAQQSDAGNTEEPIDASPSPTEGSSSRVKNERPATKPQEQKTQEPNQVSSVSQKKVNVDAAQTVKKSPAVDSQLPAATVTPIAPATRQTHKEKSGTSSSTAHIDGSKITEKTTRDKKEGPATKKRKTDEESHETTAAQNKLKLKKPPSATKPSVVGSNSIANPVASATTPATQKKQKDNAGGLSTSTPALMDATTPTGNPTSRVKHERSSTRMQQKVEEVAPVAQKKAAKVAVTETPTKPAVTGETSSSTPCVPVTSDSQTKQEIGTISFSTSQKELPKKTEKSTNEEPSSRKQPTLETNQVTPATQKKEKMNQPQTQPLTKKPADGGTSSTATKTKTPEKSSSSNVKKETPDTRVQQKNEEESQVTPLVPEEAKKDESQILNKSPASASTTSTLPKTSATPVARPKQKEETGASTTNTPVDTSTATEKPIPKKPETGKDRQETSAAQKKKVELQRTPTKPPTPVPVHSSSSTSTTTAPVPPAKRQKQKEEDGASRSSSRLSQQDPETDSEALDTEMKLTSRPRTRNQKDEQQPKKKKESGNTSSGSQVPAIKDVKSSTPKTKATPPSSTLSGLQSSSRTTSQQDTNVTRKRKEAGSESIKTDKKDEQEPSAKSGKLATQSKDTAVSSQAASSSFSQESLPVIPSSLAPTTEKSPGKAPESKKSPSTTSTSTPLPDASVTPKKSLAEDVKNKEELRQQTISADQDTPSKAQESSSQVSLTEDPITLQQSATPQKTIKTPSKAPKATTHNQDLAGTAPEQATKEINDGVTKKTNSGDKVAKLAAESSGNKEKQNKVSQGSASGISDSLNINKTASSSSPSTSDPTVPDRPTSRQQLLTEKKTPSKTPVRKEEQHSLDDQKRSASSSEATNTVRKTVPITTKDGKSKSQSSVSKNSSPSTVSTVEQKMVPAQQKEVKLPEPAQDSKMTQSSSNSKPQQDTSTIQKKTQVPAAKEDNLTAQSKDSTKLSSPKTLSEAPIPANSTSESPKSSAKAPDTKRTQSSSSAKPNQSTSTMQRKQDGAIDPEKKSGKSPIAKDEKLKTEKKDSAKPSSSELPSQVPLLSGSSSQPKSAVALPKTEKAPESKNQLSSSSTPQKPIVNRKRKEAGTDLTGKKVQEVSAANEGVNGDEMTPKPAKRPAVSLDAEFGAEPSSHEEVHTTTASHEETPMAGPTSSQTPSSSVETSKSLSKQKNRDTSAPKKNTVDVVKSEKSTESPKKKVNDANSSVNSSVVPMDVDGEVSKSITTLTASSNPIVQTKELAENSASTASTIPVLPKTTVPAPEVSSPVQTSVTKEQESSMPSSSSPTAVAEPSSSGGTVLKKKKKKKLMKKVGEGAAEPKLKKKKKLIKKIAEGVVKPKLKKKKMLSTETDVKTATSSVQSETTLKQPAAEPSPSQPKSKLTSKPSSVQRSLKPSTSGAASSRTGTSSTPSSSTPGPSSRPGQSSSNSHRSRQEASPPPRPRITRAAAARMPPPSDAAIRVQNGTHQVAEDPQPKYLFDGTVFTLIQAPAESSWPIQIHPENPILLPIIR